MCTMLVSTVVCMNAHSVTDQLSKCLLMFILLFFASFGVVCMLTNITCSSYCSTTTEDMDLQGGHYETGYFVLTAFVSLARTW